MMVSCALPEATGVSAPPSGHHRLPLNILAHPFSVWLGR